MKRTRPSPAAKFLSKFVPAIKDNLNKDMNFDIFAEGKKVGSADVFKESKSSINVVWISVDDANRGKGIGTAAMKGIIQRAKDKGYKQITLEVPGNAEDAKHIYEKLGFKSVKVLSTDDVWGGLTSMKMKL